MKVFRELLFGRMGILVQIPITRTLKILRKSVKKFEFMTRRILYKRASVCGLMMGDSSKSADQYHV